SIGQMGAWPWPRQNHADLIRKLIRDQVSDIVFDVDFSSPSNPASDQAFVDALRAANGAVVLPAFKQRVTDKDGTTTLHVNRPLPRFEENAWSAIVNLVVEPDGLVRRYWRGDRIDGEMLPSLGALLAGTAEINEQPIRIDFSIRAASLPSVSYADVLRD